MNMKKKFLAAVLVICLCISLAPAVRAEGLSQKAGHVMFGVQDESFDPIEGARIKIKDGDTVIASGLTTASGDFSAYYIPSGTYTLVVTRSGYEGDTRTLIVEENAFSISGTGNLGTKVINLKASTNSSYDLRGFYNESTGEFTLAVYIMSPEQYVLSGAFGLDYDKRIFKLKEFQFADDTECADPNNVRDFGLDSFTKDHPEEGYHTFFWMKKQGAEFNTSVPMGAKVATYVFTTELSTGDDLSGLIDEQSFRVKDFSQTDVYDALMEKGAVGEQLVAEYWDRGNYPLESTPGRYQIWHMNCDTDGNLYGFPSQTGAYANFTYVDQKYSRVNFQVYEGTVDGSGNIIPDETRQKKIENAVISIYDAAGELVGTTTTDADGSTRASLRPNQSYTYIIKDAKGEYWPAPGGDQAPEQRGVITPTQLSKTETLVVGMLNKLRYTAIIGTARTDVDTGTIRLNLYKGNASTDKKNLDTPVATATAESGKPFSMYLDASIDGEYFLIARCPGFTSCYVYGITGSRKISEVLELYGGDFDHNGFINDKDYLIFMEQYAKGKPEMEYTDLNMDGVINDNDYLLYMSNYADVGKRQNKVIILTADIT